MIVARTEIELEQGCRSLARENGLSLVPTMGALHDGHLALVRAAHASGDRVAASIFVNPLQFEQGADLARYPTEQERDLALLRDAGCALVWLPTPGVMYPTGFVTSIGVDGPAHGLEGEFRRGHFTGVATVVAILIGQVRPSTIWFGEKDWQQYQVVRRMIADLRLPVVPRAVATVRAADGLALSSRNRFLTEAERARAPLLHAQLKRAAAMIGKDEAPVFALAQANAALTSAGFAVDYLTLADAETLQPLDALSRPARIMAAARLGSVRLLDNVAVDGTAV